MLGRPRPLLQKKCVDLWAAATEFAPMVKLIGHAGVSVSVYLQDGWFSGPFGRRMAARHLRDPDSVAEVDSVDSDILGR